MDKMIIESSLPIYGASMRAPSSSEKSLGLWMDRIGQTWDSKKTAGLRLLGNYGVLEVLEGSGLFYSALTDWVDVSAGTVILIFPDIPHFYQADKKWHTRWVVFNGPLADCFRNNSFITPEDPLISGCHEIFDPFYKTLKCNFDDDEKDAALVNFTALINIISGLSKFKTAGISDEDSLVFKVKEYICNHCVSDLSPSGIARAYDISYSYLRKIFKDQEGVSVKEFIINERLSQAKTLLLDTNLPSKQIAGKVGYNDYLYFMRVFKRNTGVPVGEYRKRNTSKSVVYYLHENRKN